MTFLYKIIILPIESFVEFIFYFSLTEFSVFGVGGAIVTVSLIINILALPLYNIADKIQLKERLIQNKMSERIARIKKAFKGDERFMMLNTYYRINNYHPLYALRSSLSILIEIPFFIAAYHFLSHCSALVGNNILFFHDLSQPDSLISCSLFERTIVINILPILMTLINCVSGYIYTKGAALKEKIQIYILALIFFVILYSSPSGLVLYWILNNLFSLCKNIVLKMRKPGKVFFLFLCMIFTFISLYVLIFKYDAPPLKKIAVLSFNVLFVFAPRIKKIFLYIFKDANVTKSCIKQEFAVFLCSCIALWLFSGLLLPASVISTAVLDFAGHGDTANPVRYVLENCIYFFGLFVFWPICLYKMFDGKVRLGIIFVVFSVTVCAIANAFVFAYKYGALTVLFELTDTAILQDCSMKYLLAPVLVIVCTMFFFCIVIKYRKWSIAGFVMLSVCFAEFFVGIMKVKYINDSYNSSVTKDMEDGKKLNTEYHLSKTQNNVIVLFLDRAISCFFPYIMEQFPDLKASFDGFTYYPNCVSFADYTNFGTPPMNGGYDYTIDELNKRNNVLLKDKHNESLLVMPLIFSQAGYRTTVTDMPYPDYTDSDYSMFDKYKNIIVYDNQRKFGDMYKHNYLDYIKDESDRNILNACRQFCILQMMYPPLRVTLYHDGAYFYEKKAYGGINESFINAYSALFYLPDITEYDSDEKTFTYIANTTPHEYTTLLAPDYKPGIVDENHIAAGTGTYKYKYNDTFGSNNDLQAYHSNAASLIQVGRFLRALKDNGVYDNTRIVIVADHGRDLELPPFENLKYSRDAAALNPLLLYKDFNSSGTISTDSVFMTNAETVNLARDNLNVSDINPFTKRQFRTVNDFDDFKVYLLDEFRVRIFNNKTTVPLSGKKEYIVKSDIFKDENWCLCDGEKK